MIKKITIIFVLVLVFIFNFFSYINAKESLPNNITSEGYILMDIDSGVILAKKNENKKYEPASITKILTALIVLEKGNLNDKLTAKGDAILEEGSSLYLKEGEVLTVEQLLYGLMLQSGNDAANVLAEYISGSKEAFANEMNKKAKELGAKNSNFTNPHGLNDENHYTTPKDFAIISKVALENPEFKKIVSTVRYEVPPSNQFPETRYFLNHNKLIASEQYLYEGANGVKTGFTKKSLHTFVGSASKDNTNLLVVLFKNPTQCYEDSKLLFDYGFNNYKTQTIVSKNKSVDTINLEDNSTVNLISSETFSYPINKNNPEQITQDIEYLNIDNFSSGDTIAKLHIEINKSAVKTIDLKSDKDYKNNIISKVTFNNTYTHAFFIIIFLLFILIMILLNVRIKKHKTS